MIQLLSSYMQLQKLPSIWTDSSSTINYPRPTLAIDKSKRFEYNSIYYRDDPTKPKKKVDEFMFPHDLLTRFRKSIREASKSKSQEKNGRQPRRYRSAFEEEEERPDGVQPRANQITMKLYQRPSSLARERDFFGNRTSLQEKELGELCRLPHCAPSHNSSNQKIYITAAQRLDLSRPNNFNPGPGAYLFSTISTQKRGFTSMHSEEALLKRKGRVMRSIEIQESIHH